MRIGRSVSSGGRRALLPVLAAIHGQRTGRSGGRQWLRSQTDSSGRSHLLDVGSLAAVHAAVPPVLDGVVATVAKSTGDFSPSFTHLMDELLDQLAFLSRNRFVIEARFQVLVISFSTLLR